MHQRITVVYIKIMTGDYCHYYYISSWYWICQAENQAVSDKYPLTQKGVFWRFAASYIAAPYTANTYKLSYRHQARH